MITPQFLLSSTTKLKSWKQLNLELLFFKFKQLMKIQEKMGKSPIL